MIQAFETTHRDAAAIYAAWDSFNHLNRQPRPHRIGDPECRVFPHFPPQLKIIALASVGHDKFNSEALRARGVFLTNVPSYYSKGCEDVADVALYLTLSTFRFFQTFERKFEESRTTARARGELNVDGFDSREGKAGAQKLQGFAFGHNAGGSKYFVCVFFLSCPSRLQLS